ncbi:sulfotransferase 1B1-like [Diadema antillarum]|uniref:sulfotransferase 1B1-like n=1 Tax=Diadema antillarum TaxID=105358 RepID=UPI003A8B9262
MAEGPHLANIRGYHDYDRIYYCNLVLDSSVEALRTFEVRHDDVWIVTYPKAGTHWMLEIVGLILSDGYPEKIDRSSSSTLIEMIDLDQKLPDTKEEEEQNPPDMTPFMEKIKEAPSPRIIQTHLRLKYIPHDLLTKAKVIYITRNPKDTAVSFFNFTKDYPAEIPMTWNRMFEHFIGSNPQYGTWSSHVKEFWEIRQEDNLLFVFYEDILQDPVKHIKMVAAHIGRTLSDEVLQRVLENSSLSKMKKNYEGKATDQTEKQNESVRLQFVFKGQKGRWKDYFTVAQNEIFDEWFRKEMKGVDIDVSFE